MTPGRKYPGDLQLAILDVLWARGEATVTDVHHALLATRGLAPTTISTMLSKMEKRGLVTHRTEGRQYVYRAQVERGDVRRDMVSDVVDKAFAGRASDMVSHLLREGDFDAAELEALRAELAARTGNSASAGGRGDATPNRAPRPEGGDHA